MRKSLCCVSVLVFWLHPGVIFGSKAVLFGFLSERSQGLLTTKVILVSKIGDKFPFGAHLVDVSPDSSLRQPKVSVWLLSFHECERYHLI